MALSGVIASAHRHSDAWAPRDAAVDAIRFLPSGPFLKTASMGYDSLVADLLWTRVTSMFGERYGSGDTDWYPWLYHMTDLVTDLDPQFRAAYKYGGTMLRMDGIFVDQSSLILQKGTRHIPGEWYFPFSIAMNYFQYHEDRFVAARYMEDAARVAREARDQPGGPADGNGGSAFAGPDYLHNLAVSLYTDADALELGLAFLLEEKRYLPEGGARVAVEVKILETRYLIARRDAMAAVDVFRKRHGGLPQLGVKTTDGQLELPSDPLGGSWVWDSNPDAAPGSLVSDAYFEVFSTIAEETGLGSHERGGDGG